MRLSVVVTQNGPSCAPPDPRVQRTRPCASLRGSPLTRHPFDSVRTTLLGWPPAGLDYATRLLSE